MKKMVFFVTIYWELHWLHNVIEAMGGEVFTEDKECLAYCEKYNFKVVESVKDYDILIVSVVHFGQQNDMIHRFSNEGKKVVVIQHGWDPAISLYDNFWNLDVGTFDYYLVGCQQDYKWLTEKFGDERIIMTGIPRLDDIYNVKKSRASLKPIYDLVGTDKFYLVNAPTDVFNEELHQKYCNPVIQASPYKVVYKTHPGHNFVPSFPEITAHPDKYMMVSDDILDRKHIYRLIKASQGVAIVESLLLMEASFFKKPAIFWGHELLPADLYDRPENVNQIERLPIEMSSTFDKPEFKPKQAEMVKKYMLDGKNTERVVKFLKLLTKTKE